MIAAVLGANGQVGSDLVRMAKGFPKMRSPARSDGSGSTGHLVETFDLALRETVQWWYLPTFLGANE
jgi:hypothetical protein